MRDRPYRQIAVDLVPLCADEGVAIEKSMNRTGHHTLSFVDLSSEQRLSVVLFGRKDISSASQQRMLTYLSRRASEFPNGHAAYRHAEHVRKILKAYFAS